MSRRSVQIIVRGDRRWLVRVYLGRDRETHEARRPQSIKMPPRGNAYRLSLFVDCLSARHSS